MPRKLLRRLLFLKRTNGNARRKTTLPLSLEYLEDRTLLANPPIYWTGAAAVPNWSARGNWAVLNPNNNLPMLAPNVPGKDDLAVFSDKVIQLAGGSKYSEVDAGLGRFYLVGGLRLKDDFTGTIKLLRSFTTLDMKDSSKEQGTIDVDKYTLTDEGGGAVSEWISGTIRGTKIGGYRLTTIGGAGLMNIGGQGSSSNGEPVLFGTKLSFATGCNVRWESGNFSVRNSATINNDGEFVINSSGGDLGGSEKGITFWNTGKVIANTSANLKKDFWNSSKAQTTVNAGKLSLFREGFSNGKFMVAKNAEISFKTTSYNWSDGTEFEGDCPPSRNDCHFWRLNR